MSLLKNLGSQIGLRVAARVRVRPSVKEASILKSNFIKDVLDRADKVPEVSRRLSGEEYVHITGLKTYCQRADILSRETNMPVFQSVTGGHKVMWVMGRAVEAHIRNTFIAARDNQGVLGAWKCKCGHRSCIGLLPAKRTICPRCKTETTYYNELPLFDHEAGIVGNPDMPIVLSDNTVVPVEIKSMNKEEFSALDAPLPDHVQQVLGYRRLLRVNNYQPNRTSVVLYCTKDFKWGSPYKEYHVNEEAYPHHAQYLDLMWAQVKAARAYRKGMPLPERLPVCTAITDARAKKCSCHGSCFMRR